MRTLKSKSLKSIFATFILLTPSHHAFTFTTKIHKIHFSHNNLCMSTSSDDDLSGVRVMVNGMPGPMAVAAAEACLRKWT